MDIYWYFPYFQYAEKAFIRKPRNDHNHLLSAHQIWESVYINDKKAVYQHIVASNADVNTVFEQTSFSNSLTLAKALLLQEQMSPVFDRSSSCTVGESEHWVSALNSFSSLGGGSENRDETNESYEGFSLLHLACQTADIGMVELLLQYGANVNAMDMRMMSPLHHCILRGRHAFTKLLISRWFSYSWMSVLKHVSLWGSSFAFFLWSSGDLLGSFFEFYVLLMNAFNSHQLACFCDINHIYAWYDLIADDSSLFWKLSEIFFRIS